MVIGMKGNSFGSRRQNSPQSRAEIPSPVYHWSRVRILADSIRPNLKRGSEEAAPPLGGRRERHRLVIGQEMGMFAASRQYSEKRGAAKNLSRFKRSSPLPDYQGVGRPGGREVRREDRT